MNEVAELEAQKDELKAAVDRRDSALKLSKNRDFRKLILEFFCRDECARYVHTSLDPNLSDKERADALALAQASGHLKRFLSVVMQMGNSAEGTIRDIDTAIEVARIEEGAE